jgi:hypothetical protein
MSINVSSISRISSIIQVISSKFELPSEARMVYVMSKVECNITLPKVFDIYSELTIKRHPDMTSNVNLTPNTSDGRNVLIDTNDGITLDEDGSSVKLRYYENSWYIVS